MAVPRLQSRSLPPDTALNAMAAEIDDIGVALRLRRTSTASLAANVAQIVSWQSNTTDTRGDAWDPATPTLLTIRLSGMYFFEARIRYGTAGGSSTGDRHVQLIKGSTITDPIVVFDRQYGLATDEGTTCVTRDIRPCYAGDVYTVAVKSSVAVTALHQDYGGTYFFVARLGPLGATGVGLTGQAFEPPPDPGPGSFYGPDLVAAPRYGGPS